MTPLELFTYAGWTLATPDRACVLKVERATEWCVDGTCAGVEATAEHPDVWKLTAGAELHWTAPDTAELECQGGRVTAKVLRESASARTAPEVPAATLAEALGVEPGRVVPGSWSGGTRECAEGTEAWLFEPFDRSRPSLFVARENAEWVVAPAKSGVVMCPGGKSGGIYRSRAAQP
ncbi:MAG: hypothetical protein R3F61_05730 [Myxococcota bacterium]